MKDIIEEDFGKDEKKLIKTRRTGERILEDLNDRVSPL